MQALRSLIAMLLLASCAALAAPQNGWWWNPAEDGRGFFIERRDGFTFLGAYGYDAGGRATWFVSGATTADPNHYSGPLYSMHDGQSLYGPYRAPAGPDNAGTLTIDFSDDTHGTLRWPGGTIAIERLTFGPENTTLDQPSSGWWWNAQEDGSGYSLEIQGGMLVIVGFMYDESGAPTWYLSAGPMNSPTAFHGNLLRYSNGQSMGGAYRRPTSATIGTLDIAFSDMDQATLTFTESATASAKSMVARPAAGQLRSTQITAMLPTAFTVPDHYVGWFRAEMGIDNAAVYDVFTVVGSIDKIDRVSPGSRHFAATRGTLVATLDNRAGPCTSSGGRVFTATDIVLPSAIKLEVTRRGDFIFDLYLNLNPIPIVTTCNLGPFTTTVPDNRGIARLQRVNGVSDNQYIPNSGDPLLPALPTRHDGALHGAGSNGIRPVIQRVEFSFKPCFGTAPCSP